MLFGLIAAGITVACLVGAGLLSSVGCIGTYEVAFLLLRLLKKTYGALVACFIGARLLGDEARIGTDGVMIAYFGCLRLFNNTG